MKIKVAIVEDQQDFRESWERIINAHEQFLLCGSYANAESAMDGFINQAPDVALIDIHLPGISGIELIEQFSAKHTAIRFVIFSSMNDDENIFNALKAGAKGYILKSGMAIEIMEGITDVFNGGSPMSSSIARRVVESFNKSSEANAEMQKLSAREQEIISLLAKGLRYKEIADKLFISSETVRTHIRNMYEKLAVNSRTDALNKVYRK
jgi:DNA-binding NarL/FixJ family response regulator